ncbi:CASP-like protein 4B3 [Oryza brachyantha]|uniref:CASP-like protein 4B3 n=1 Tax=Oryza brachyantha TaxID=4533 RepID=UPI001ADAECD4|nr:CASP-like protein 4B3 [Oryza brachyantha]
MASGPTGGRDDASGPGAADAAVAADGVLPVSRSVVERWKMDAAAARARLLLRALAWLFSLLALVVMASNKHGHGGAQDFDNYPEYRYCLGISIIAALYTISQVVRDVHRLSRGRDVIAARKAAAVVDFAGDQLVAYLLMSALSAAAPVTDYMRQAADNLFTDSAAAAISMAFLAFLAVGLSALVSGYNLAMEVLV